MRIAVLLLAACAPAAAPTAVGDDGWGIENHVGPAENSPAPTPRESTIPPSERERWGLADALPTLTTVPGRSMSDHFARTFERTVQLNDAAAGYLQRPPRIAPGAVIVQHHHAPGKRTIVATLVMRKRPAGYHPEGHDWAYVVLDKFQRIAAEGKLEACARCHADAPHHGLFGPPTMK